MRIRIQEAFFYADPCGSGSETLFKTSLTVYLDPGVGLLLYLPDLAAPLPDDSAHPALGSSHLLVQKLTITLSYVRCLGSFTPNQGCGSGSAWIRFYFQIKTEKMQGNW